MVRCNTRYPARPFRHHGEGWTSAASVCPLSGITMLKCRLFAMPGTAGTFALAVAFE